MKKRVKLSKAHFGNLSHFRLGNIGIIDEIHTENMVFIDIDRNNIQWLNLMSRIRTFRGLLNPEYFMLQRTRKGWHIIIVFDRELLPPEIIALQAILGSDLKREALNMTRWLGVRSKYNKLPKFWQNRWNLLFKEKIK